MSYYPPGGYLLLFGGTEPDGSTSNNDTWEWNGNGWTQILPADSPPPGNYAMAFDGVSKTVVLLDSSASGTATYEWNGTDWVLDHPAHMPSGTSDDQMAYDPTVGAVIFFGGGTSEDETWSWNGTDWTQLAPPVSPASRYRFGLTYDAKIRKLVLFGGEGPSGTPYLADTWTFDGKTWSQIFTRTTPPGRAIPGFAYDYASASVIMFGGAGDTSGRMNDTWSFNGTRWIQLAPANSPPGLQAPGMGYDNATQTEVLFGGTANDFSAPPYYTFPTDTWTFQ